MPPATDDGARSRLHPAWIVLGALTFCMLAGNGLRAVFGVYIKPMEAEFGWTRGALSGAAAVSLLIHGACGPLVGRLADRWSPRIVIGVSLLLLGLSALGSALVQTLWQVYLTAGLLLALGAGGLAMTSGMSVIARWFAARRGLAVGIAGAGMSAGQLIVVPLAMALTVWLGWRTSFFWLGVGVLVLAFPVGVWLIGNDPAARGVRPYGANGPANAPTPPAAPTPFVAPEGTAGFPVREAARYPQFWLLVATFFVCGYTTFGIALTHFVPHALEHGFTELQASSALGIMGAMNVIGTIGSGWLCDRRGRRGPLAVYYFVRGLSLVFLVYVWDVPSLHVWAAIFGLNFISTVPPTYSLTANIFGSRSVGELSGWVFFAHQIGGALGAALSGWLFESSGSYTIAILISAGLALAAAALTLAIREEPVTARPVVAAPATT